MKFYLAVDLGATSGRVILASVENAHLQMDTLHRFPTPLVKRDNGLFWDIDCICNEILEGLSKASGRKIESIGIDTWGVDFCGVRRDGSLIMPRAYRDPYTNAVPEEFFKKMPREELYRRTGIQIMNFNSVFQLYARMKSGELDEADKILFLPDALSYFLTGSMVCEYTILSTSALMNPSTRQFDDAILDVCGVSRDRFADIVLPGHTVGTLKKDIAGKCGLGEVRVVAVAGHDPASAVAAVPAKNDSFAYLSSGTWSLMGIETDEPVINETMAGLNFTNEGGATGNIRLLKNITGMWLLESCLRQWHDMGRDYSYQQITDMAYSSHNFTRFIDPDNPCFAAPESMLGAIDDFLEKTSQPAVQSDAEVVSLIFESLALKYRYVFDRLVGKIGFRPGVLHVIGGGSQNRILNQYTASALQVPVHAGPKEATAIGNAFIQASSSLSQMRRQLSRSVNVEVYVPQDTLIWNEAYERFRKILKI